MEKLLQYIFTLMMESGFFYPYRGLELISPGERRRGLLQRDIKKLNNVEADDRGSVIHLNSTYVDMIDRWFSIRGGLSSLLIFVCTLLIIGASLYGFVIAWSALPSGRVGTPWLVMVLMGVIIFMQMILLFFVYKTLGREFYTYTHFPIRFNRKTKMIHVFRDNSPDGVLSVPWGQVYFDIGRGSKQRGFLDLRAHVMEDDTVIDTFAVGHFCDSIDAVRGIWKFIVVYMEQGPQALPKDMCIGTSTSSDWLNCFLWMYSYYKNFFGIPLIKWPAVALMTGMRWVIMKSCNEPVWPSQIVSESLIESGDPWVWVEPHVTGELEAKDEKLWEALVGRHKRRQNKKY